MRLASVALHAIGSLLLLSRGQVSAGSEESSLAIACASYLTPENLQNGFGAEVDDDCKTDSNECFQINCRLCMEVSNAVTTGLTPCEEVRKKQAAKNQEAAALLQPQHEQDQVLESAMIFESAPESLSTTDCAARVSQGDRNAGLTAIYNAGCASGGLGCFSDVLCQFCRLSSATTQPFKLCSELAGSGGSTPAAATPLLDCDAAVKNSGYTGASYVIDPDCLKPLAPEGCVKASTCRLCHEYKNEGNQHLARCKVLRDQQALTGVAESARVTEYASATTSMTAASNATTVVTANTKSGTDPNAVPASESGPDAVATIAAVSVGAVVALAAVAIKSSRARRVANGSTGEESGAPMHRIDSIVNGIGRDRIATL